MSTVPPAANGLAQSRPPHHATGQISSVGNSIVSSNKLSSSTTNTKRKSGVNDSSSDVTAPRRSRTAVAKAQSMERAKVDAQVAGWLADSEFVDAEVSAKKDLPIRRTDAAMDTRPDMHVLRDDAILSKVAERLAARNIPSFARIGMNISSGTLTVYGSVGSKGERLLLMHILRTTPGVTKVNDGLTITAAHSRGPKLSGVMGRVPALPSMPTLPALPSLSSLKESLAGVSPAHAGILLACLAVLGFWFFPRSVSHPVAVYPVKSKVVLEDKPYADATVVLHPVGASKLPKGLLPRATADSAGVLVFKTFASADGAPEGEFVATVHLTKPVLVDGDMVPGPDQAPALYRTPETSPFRVKITRETKEISVLELPKID